MSDEEIKTLFNVVDKLEKRIFLLENIEIDGQNVTPVYSNTGSSSKSGSKFSSAAEVQTSRRGYKG